MTTPKSFDQVAGKYDTMRGGMDRGRQSAAALDPCLVSGPAVEIGVGTGAVAAALRELGRPVAGLDISRPMLERARARLGDRVACADARALPLADGSVPNLVYVHVLHLVGGMGAALREAARVLRPGGRLVAVHGDPVADPDELVAALERLAPLRPARPDSPEGLAAAGTAVGLHPVEQEQAVAYEQATSPEQLAASFEARVPPFLWDVDDPTWERSVAPVLADLRALPDPGLPRTQVWRSWRTVLERAGSTRADVSGE